MVGEVSISTEWGGVTLSNVVREQVLVIPGTLPDLNTTINETKKHWSKYSGTKVKIEHSIKSFIENQELHSCQRPVWLLFNWITKDLRKDGDNVAFSKKFILDSLVVGKILPKDSRKFVIGWLDNFPPADKKNARTEVRIFEIGGNE